MSKRNPKITSKIMSKIKSKNTKPEKLIASAMWSRGLRYRKHYNLLPGKPDFVFLGPKIVVFVDGDFWHGNNWKIRGLASFDEELASYSTFWKNKILTNIERDQRVTTQLEKMGWRIIRFWESDIKKDVNACAEYIYDIVKKN